MYNKSLFRTILLLFTSFTVLSYNDDPPNGRTGAPFDGHCKDCHVNNNPGGFNGLAEIVGLPDTILPDSTYAFQLKAWATTGNPVRGGFQLVVVDKNNQNIGNLSSVNNETDTEFLNNREYLDHRPGKYFGGLPISWNFNWRSPEHADCNTIRFYYIINFCNGGGDFGDFPIAFADSIYFAGALPDSIPPQIVCPESFVVDEGDTVHYAMPALSDNCAISHTDLDLLSGLPNDTVFPIGMNVLVFQATDAFGNKATCSFTVQVNELPNTGGDNLNQEEPYKLIQNPVTNDYFYITGAKSLPSRIELISMRGQCITTLPVSSWPGPFYIGEIPNGIYLLRITAPNGQLTLIKFVKTQ